MRKRRRPQVRPVSLSKLQITQVKSPIRRNHRQRETLIGLGLNRIGRVALVPETPATRGMIAKVEHLVRVLVEPLSRVVASTVWPVMLATRSTRPSLKSFSGSLRRASAWLEFSYAILPTTISAGQS